MTWSPYPDHVALVEPQFPNKITTSGRYPPIAHDRASETLPRIEPFLQRTENIRSRRVQPPAFLRALHEHARICISGSTAVAVEHRAFFTSDGLGTGRGLVGSYCRPARVEAAAPPSGASPSLSLRRSARFRNITGAQTSSPMRRGRAQCTTARERARAPPGPRRRFTTSKGGRAPLSAGQQSTEAPVSADEASPGPSPAGRATTRCRVQDLLVGDQTTEPSFHRPRRSRRRRPPPPSQGGG